MKRLNPNLAGLRDKNDRIDLSVITHNLLVSPDILLVTSNILLVSPNMLLVTSNILLVSPDVLLVTPNSLSVSPYVLLVSPNNLLVTPDKKVHVRNKKKLMQVVLHFLSTSLEPVCIKDMIFSMKKDIISCC